MATTFNTIQVTPLSPYLGGEISGVDIAAEITDQQFAEIRQAFIDHSVIFFRDQDISPDQHLDFARRWGQVNVNRFFRPTTSHPEIAEVLKESHHQVNVGGKWHTDHSYDQVPAMCSVLYAKEVPEIGGDTLFASMYAAAENLSDGLRKTLLSLRAMHSSRHAFGYSAYKDVDSKEVEGRYHSMDLATQDAVHPVIIKHPLSGRPALYVNGDFTVRFDGWSEEDSQPLLNYLYAHAVKNEFTCRFSWQKGSIAIWDNRATQHFALNDYHGKRRYMHRITIEGEALHPA